MGGAERATIRDPDDHGLARRAAPLSGQHHAEPYYIPYGPRSRQTMSPTISEASRSSAARLHPLRRASGPREQRPRAAGGVPRPRDRHEAGRVGDAPYADDYQASSSRVRGPRVHVHRVPFRRRVSDSAAQRRHLRRADGGRRHAPRDRRGDGRRQLRRGQRPRAERRGRSARPAWSTEGREGAAGLRRVLRALLDDPAAVQRFRDLAAARARDVYSWDAVTTQYEELAEAVLEDARTSPREVGFAHGLRPHPRVRGSPQGRRPGRPGGVGGPGARLSRAGSLGLRLAARLVLRAPPRPRRRPASSASATCACCTRAT